MQDGDYVIGVDTGGTFTDAALLTPDGDLVIGKAATTPSDLALGVMNAVSNVARQMSLSVAQMLARVDVFKHSTTVATNALITRSGSKVGLLTTRGIEDTPLIMRAIGRVDGLPKEEVRHVTYVTKPEPLVDPDAIRGVTERIDYQGNVLVPLNLDEVDAAVHELVEVQGCTAVAVCLLHAWANPAHEEAIRARVLDRRLGRRVYWSFGSDLSSPAGEYARTNTAIINASVGPTVERYLQDLEVKFREGGFAGAFLVMKGNGGVAARDQSPPVASLQSGPAGGVIASAHMAALLGHKKILTADMGGTSFDVSLIVDGVWRYAEEPIFERFRILQPVAEIASIGAGGGTIARVDPATKRLLVGPQSAGASPGPVCYDEGGEQITVTDADVLLGYIDPEYFLGGHKRLDRAKAEQMMRTAIAEPLGLSVTEAAFGIYQIVNNKMSDLMRRQVIKSGHLPEEFVLYAFGGASPVHAAECTRELGIGTVYIFPTSPVFSAFGAALADVIHSRVVTFPAVMPFDAEIFNRRIEAIERELLAVMEREHLHLGDAQFRRFASMRFRRQTYGVELELPWERLDAGKVRVLGQLFERKYEELYGKGSGFAKAGIEVHILRVDAVGPIPKPRIAPEPPAPSDGRDARKGTRSAYFAGRVLETPVYDHARLRPGARIAGPAVVEAPLTTIVVPPGCRAETDGFRNLIIRIG